MADPAFLPPVAWHASLPGVVMASAGLIGDGEGRVLVVKANYREHWTLPGGICEFGESPQAGCAREVAEELGIRLPVGRMLAVDWQLPQDIYGPQARPAVSFVFDCGVLPSLSGVRLQAEELDDCRFAAEPELYGMLADTYAPRIRAALWSLSSGGARYVPDLAKQVEPG
ncbi:MAG: NUDIX hydrolase [Actinobacteria bacterium]|nr:NUDIX hydrolase [Actinomycetota bacterium]